MALEIKLGQKLTQSLQMTPQLQQAIKLLQLGRLEYLAVIQKELLENPVLEDAKMESRETIGEQSGEREVSELPKSVDEISKSQDFSHDLPYEDASHSFSSLGKSSSFDSEDFPSLEATVGERLGLSSHLLSQLNVSELSSFDREIASKIIGNLDSDGFLRVPREELLESIGVSEEEFEKVLGVLQTFEPVGVFARSIAECLLIQLESIGHKQGLVARIVEHHLGLLENKGYDKIANIEKVSKEEVYEAIKLIRTLEPRPARDFADEPPIYITPDVYVRIVEGDYVVTLNDNGMPKLRLSPKYQEMLKEATSKKEKESKTYLKNSINSASFLIRSIQQRQETIFRVTESIFRHQRDFLEQGVKALKPLVLREVAEDIEMHESTVSRVTTNKYVHTPQGVFELKFFFSSSLKGGEGDVSAQSVKAKLKTLIESENPKAPYSDQALVKLLAEQDVVIARRTVAKYRESLGFLSSSKRKKVF